MLPLESPELELVLNPQPDKSRRAKKMGANTCLTPYIALKNANRRDRLSKFVVVW
jgi:hypothetical protein